MSLTETALTNRRARNQSTDDVYDDGYLRVEHKNYYLSCGEESIQLRKTEFLIISRLVRSLEGVVSPQDLWRYAWGTHKPLNSKSLYVYIYRVRSKLIPYGLRIDTMVNVGYRLLVRKR